MRVLPLLLAPVAAIGAAAPVLGPVAPGRALALEYRVTSRPVGRAGVSLGTLRVLVETPARGIGRTLLVSTRAGFEERALYARDLCVLRRTEPASDLAQMRPRTTFGLVRNVPIFPAGVLTIDLTAPAPGRPDLTLVAEPDAVSYGSLFLRPAATRTVRVGGRTPPRSFTLDHEGVRETVWSYEEYRSLGGRLVPARIRREDTPAPGAAGSVAGTTDWTLVRAGEAPAAELDESRVLAPRITVQDDRETDHPVAFTYDPRAGTLKRQAEDASWSEGETATGDRISHTLKVAATAFAVVAAASLALLVIALRGRR